ncbi:MAG: hypothetical protein ACO1SX_23080 [Actinomycetota bacterium]
MQRNRGPIFLAAGAMLSLAVVAGAQTPGPSDLALVAETVAVRHRIRLLVDPELQSPRGLRSPAQGFSVDRALDALCSRMSGAAWRRVYLPERTAAKPDAARLAAVIRSLNAVDPGHLVVHAPERDELIRFIRVPGPVGAPPPPAAGTSELFVLYNAAAASDGRSPEARVADLQRQQLALQSADEHLPLGVAELLHLMQTLPPDRMERLAGPTVLAGDRLWDATPPDQRRSMMQQTMEVLRPLLNPAPARQGANAGPGARPVPPVNRLPVLGRIARELAKKNETTILLDPDLFITVKPIPPGDDPLLSKSLDRLVGPLAGVRWRKIQTPQNLDGKLETRRTAAILARAVRTLQGLEFPELTLHDAGSGNTTTYRSQPAKKATAAPERAPLLHAAPIYVLFDDSPAAAGRTAAERLRSIQRQQFQEMFRMNPDQLARSMEGAIRTYETADPATQKRVLALPMMSGMMAGWFPRLAKESGR